ncbi:glycosyl hydrolase [Actinoplanes aureus]|uniref:Ricin-type beta-trefoil lectin domain protein n=1 Tax=Actinoplanes aureus TaxID=2792083 RepID=A0A931C9A1_9ACTN|nr:glycosyl hydrolase [Actinoplanes aureus]MBG0563732.1 ricin-type beta-trefoil lectin domain protein [Actinoplanes aureus]
MRRTRSSRVIAAAAGILTASLLIAGIVRTAGPADAFAATSKATVINYLRSITGSSIVSGQHNKEPASSPAQYTQQVRNVTGQFPGLWGGDMMFRADDQANRQRVVDEAKAQWAAGSLVALTWHACSPTVGATCEFDGGVKTQISNAQFQEVVTAGTALNNTWRSRMAAVVPYLKQLKDAGIPVLWRPFHEMNETWNWWGGRPGANGGAKIYQQMRDYFDSQGLDNLIWVWNVQDNPTANWAQYYPGANYADVVSLDVWWKSHPSAADYSQIQSVAAGKPIAIAEMGKVPNASLLSSQPRWAYFMIWSEQLLGSNSTAEIQAAYNLPRVLNRGEINIGAGPVTPTTGSTTAPAARTGKIRAVAADKCVDVAGANAANGTQVQIYTCDVGGSAQQWTVGTDGTIRALGKCLDVAAAGTADGARIQIYDCNGGNAQRFTYNAATRDLVNAGSGKCLEVRAEATANSTPLQLWTCNGKANQDFTLPA